MDFDNTTKRVLALSAEAKRRTVKEMWNVREEQAFIPRLGKSMIGCVLRSEAVRGVALSRVSKNAGGLAVLGHGGEQIVMADGNDVIKLLFNTISPDEARTNEEARKLQTEADICQEYLKDYWMPTTFETVEIGNGSRHAVIARQERLVDPTFYRASAGIKASPKLQDTAENLLRLHSEVGLLPDLLGPDNIEIVSADGSLRQIDTIPVRPSVLSETANGSHMTNGELLLQQVDNWLKVA